MTDTTHINAIVQPPEHASAQPILGGSISIRLRAEDSGGRVSVLDQVVPDGYPGPPLHVHPDFDETFFVIEGRLGVRVGDEAHEAGPGTVAFVPRGTPHTFANTSGAPARWIVMLSPGGFERYFEELIALIDDLGGLPPPDVLRDLGIAHGSVPA